LQGQAAHEVVTPSQVTCPGSPTEQLPSTAEQLVLLLLPSQLTVPPAAQFAVAVHRAFSITPPMRGRFAAGVGAGVPTGAASEAMKA